MSSSTPALGVDRAQAYVGAFLRRADARREVNAAALEGDLHLDENGQIIRPAQAAEDGARDPADALHDVGTFAQVCCCKSRREHGRTQPGRGVLPTTTSQQDPVVSYKRVSRRYEVVQILPVQRHVRAAHQTVLLTNPSRCTRLTLLAVQYFQYPSSAFACMGITHSIRNSFEMRSNLYHLTVASPHRFTQSRHQRVAHNCCCLATGG